MKSKALKRRVTVTVRTKRGKTYKRSIEKLAVQIGNQGVRHALKEEHAEKLRSQGVNSQNRILAAVKGIFSRKVNQQAGVLHAMNPGRHGGSSHSWFAERIGAFRRENHSTEYVGGDDHSGSAHAAWRRAGAGGTGARMAEDNNNIPYYHGPSDRAELFSGGTRNFEWHQRNLEWQYGAENVTRVPRNPNRWVR